MATTLAKAETDWKVLVESQFRFMRETEKRKYLLRGRMSKLGIALPPKKFPTLDDGDAKWADAKIGDHVVGRLGENNTVGGGKMLGKRVPKQEIPSVGEPSDEEVAEKALAAAIAQLSSPVEGEN